MLNMFFKFVGLSSGKSLQSAADPQSAKHPKQGITLDKPEIHRSATHGVAGSARRQEVKTPVKKSTAVKKPVVKAKPAPAKKVTAKPVAKPSKPAAKPASKTAVKPTPTAPAKKAAAKAVKPIAKVVSKPAKLAKTIAKAPAKAAKPAIKPAVKKPVVPAKPAKVLAKVPAKPIPKAPIQVSAKPPVKAPAKAPISSSTSKPSVQSAAKPVAKQPVAVSAPVKAVVAAPVVVVKPRVSKSGFISPANIAPKPMEVSTAAKTNFTMSSPALAPPHQVVVKKDAKLANNWKTQTAAQLTDAEAIAMPDSEYMSALQMAFFRLKLVQLKKDILSNAGATTEHLREDTSVVPDPADRATIEEEHALELRTRDRERKLLKKIEQSITRIDSEDYGYCDETGEPIGVSRLIARPTANLSLEAQQRRELKQKMFGD